MPLFRVRTTDGAERTVEAHRVITDVDTVSFEHRRDGLWHAALSLPLDEVDVIHRRVNEFDGRYMWMVERPGRALGSRTQGLTGS